MCKKESLYRLAKEIKEFVGVSRKRPIIRVTSALTDTLEFSDAKIIRSFGEDAAILDIGNGRLLLFAADGIWYKLVSADPFFAGYCAVLVNVNDIVCKGGDPLALVDILGVPKECDIDKVVRGIIRGCKKFGVSCVGGHLHPDHPIPEISAAIIGVAEYNKVIFSDLARPGDLIIIGIDLDGKFHEKFKLAWDTTSHKSPKQIRDMFQAMYIIADEGLATASKDISNPGVLGSLGMLLEASQVGGYVYPDKIPIPENVSIYTWVKTYPGFGVVLTSPEDLANKCVKILEDHGISASIVGKVISDPLLLLKSDNEMAEVFNFSRDKISGRPNRGQLKQI
ncbi:MAG: methanogenesis marker 2 protein [Candidatus Baldrarchaeia archaeon]